MAGKTVLILGGGVGGLTAANALRRRLRSEHRVVLVDKTGEHLFAPSLLWLIGGARRPAQVTKDLRRMVLPNVEVLRADVQGIDPVQARVATSTGTLSYDALVVALGAELAPDALPGYAAAAHNFYSLDGASRLGQALQRFEGGRLLVAVTGLPFKCPAAPYEAALLIDDALRRRGLRERTEIEVFTPEPQPMPVAGPAMGEAVTALLSQRGIRFHPNRPLAAIAPGERTAGAADGEGAGGIRGELVFQDGAREGFDLLAAVPPHRAPQAVRESPLANPAGWIPVDRHSLATGHGGVYAVGDVATITLANGRPLPKAGVFAHREAIAVARTVAANLQGGSAGTFDGAGYCWLEIGQGQAAFASGDFFAEPNPVVSLRPPGRLWHAGKVLFERYWMGEGVERAGAALALTAGGRMLGVPAGL